VSCFSIANPFTPFRFSSIRVSVRLGEYKISTDPDCKRFGPEMICNEPIQNIPIENITIHENYVINVKRKDYRGGQNDIALVRLKDAAALNKRSVTPICLPVAGSKQLIDLSKKKKTLHVAGWGLTENGKLLCALVQE
jgi:hypothetical protein